MSRGLTATAVVVLGATVAAFVLLTSGPDIDRGLLTQLERRGVIGVLGETPPDLFELELPETTLRPVDSEAMLKALDADDPIALREAMSDAGLDALLVAAGRRTEETPATLREALVQYRHVDGLRGIYLTPTFGLYEPAISADLGEEASVMLPQVARTILEGNDPPRVSRFPEPLRRIRSVEVMVLLRDRGRARLWRSARGSSVGRALVTAAVVARQRWEEREQALGGPLDGRLPHLDVEVTLLEEDGTLGVTAPAFVERAFYEDHGVAYESPGAWRYQLPDATRVAGEGSAVRAYEKLFQDNALPEDSLRRADLRFYRLVTASVGRSPAPFSTDGLGPDAVLDVVDDLL